MGSNFVSELSVAHVSISGASAGVLLPNPGDNFLEAQGVHSLFAVR